MSATMFVTDLDDTLYKEMDYVGSAFRAISTRLESEGVMPYAVAMERLTSAPNHYVGFERLYDGLGIDPATAARFDVEMMKEVYRSHMPDIHLSEGVEATLRSLRNAGVEVGIITDGRPVTQRNKIAALGLGRFVDDENIIISGEIHADKHTPLPFRLMMERNPSVSRFIYIGDNPLKDFHWPNRLGWTTVMLRDPEGRNVHDHSRDLLAEGYSARYSIDSFSEVIGLPGLFL